MARTPHRFCNPIGSHMRPALFLTIPVVSIIAIAGCGSSSGSSSSGGGSAYGGGSTASKPVSTASSQVSVRKTDLGSILVDSQGRTLYLFEKDSSPKSTCNG